MTESVSYGEEWRSRARLGLTLSADERNQWESEQSWERANVELATRLDALVGTMVATGRVLHTIDDSTIPSGTRFLVRARFGDRLLCESVKHGLLSLAPAWIELRELEQEEAVEMIA
ncbi:hypothetical protein [Sandaracinus amylolyticus]|uniref:hypothetical protein n=1 Tax=Sandaracinus amylolyticus TaxID=927083 RepID=UPI00069E4ED2|nr:hypothetical protein [Sandaracinus amylolyticus]